MSQHELQVLQFLCQRGVAEPNPSHITEISSSTGIRNNDEVRRALYILEGKTLVQPEPAGDLTSNVWKVTTLGARAVDLLNEN